MDTGHIKCINCDVLLWKSNSRKKKIKSLLEVRKWSGILGKEVNVNDVLCNKCRMIIYRSERNMAAEEHEEVAIPSTSHDQPPLQLPLLQESIQTSSSSEEVFVLQGSSSESDRLNSSREDPSFHLNISDNATVETEYVEMPFSRVVSTHGYCFVCGSRRNIINLPNETRKQVFVLRRLYIPKGNRCCPSHLIKKMLFQEDVANLRSHSNCAVIEVHELRNYFEYLSINCDSTIQDKIGDYTLSEERLQAFTGLTWGNIIKLREMMLSMRDSKCRNVTQAIVTFLFKLRTGNSNKTIAAILGLEREQLVSDFCASVINSFEKDILPAYFGFTAFSRQHLIETETSYIAKKLHNVTDQLALIFDGTYIRHGKSSNNEYQRKSYSGQKKVPLCKPFTICTTAGYIVEMIGPFYATQNDAEIMKIVMNDPNGLRTLLKKGDICIVDRGFRDVHNYLENEGYRVLMPALKGKRHQLPTVEANNSRLVTKVRWVVEAIHGIIGQKYRLLHHQLDNKLLPTVRSFFRIACFLQNMFGKRLRSDSELSEEIISRISEQKEKENTLGVEVETHRWNRRKTPFKKITSGDLLDFPEITERDLRVFFTGSYQFSQTVSYLAELINSDNEINFSYLKANSNITQFQVQSRHISKKLYKCYIDYTPNGIGCSGIKRHFCECANGNRTIGCCSHVAAIIYYLSHARYTAKIIKPAEILSKIFNTEHVNPVINDDSDED